jgi:hypothetical protein
MNRIQISLMPVRWHPRSYPASLLGEAAFFLPDFQAFAYFVDGSSGFRY